MHIRVLPMKRLPEILDIYGNLLLGDIVEGNDAWGGRIFKTIETTV